MRIATFLLSTLLCTPVMAGNLNIEFVNPDKYLDIDSGREMQSRFTERLKSNLTESFAEVAQSLPADQTLQINITQIDLAGDTRFGMGDMYDVRIMKDLYRPLLAFDVKVMDDTQQVILEKSEKLVDSNYLDRSFIVGSKPFGYEQAMVERWGKKFVNTLR